jgi:predicted O-methyltransferase YrrM
MKKLLAKLAGVIFSPLTLLSAFWLRTVRRYLVTFFNGRSVLSRTIFTRVGVFPILDHYYEPLFQPSHLRFPLSKDRDLPGIEFNAAGQLSLLNRFNYNDEIVEISKRAQNELTFSFSKGPFRAGDAEYLYNIIRLYKPKRIVELGSGHSTLMAQHAIRKNAEEHGTYHCEHLCIEPYSNRWLEKLPVTVIRSQVETTDKHFFKELKANDILFIDSSHMIRPQGDVLFEYLEVLPVLNTGVLVHVHDIFSPKDYPADWLTKGLVFWNEQYLLEAFLSQNGSYKIVGALNYLKHHHWEEISLKCPMLSLDTEPGSFWIVRGEQGG